jgi:hypothetical protein
VKRDLRALEHPQQLSFVGMQQGEQSAECDKAGSALEDPVEGGAQGGLAVGRRIAAIGLVSAE